MAEANATNGVHPDQADREVWLEECICPDKAHGAEGDTITLRETLDYQAVRTIRYAASLDQDDDPDSSIASLMAGMNEGFILQGVESWTLADKGKPIPVDRHAIRQHLLGNMVAAQIVGDYADLLYQSQVLLPLAALARRSSQPSPTSASTSASSGVESKSPTATVASNGKKSNHSAKPPKRSKQSSTTSTPTASIAATTFDSAGGSTS